MKLKSQQITYPGFFISFEGGEGAGKSTQIRHLVNYFKKLNIPVVLTLEPGGTAIGTHIREMLLNPNHTHLHPRAELLLYLADRAQHVEECILPALKRGEIVITDRYADSSNVYQGICRKLGLETTFTLNDYATQGLYPDIALVLDLPPKIAFNRMKHRKLDRMEREKSTFHNQVRRGFLHLSEKYPKRIQVVNATKSEEEVRIAIQELLVSAIQKKFRNMKRSLIWKRMKPIKQLSKLR